MGASTIITLRGGLPSLALTSPRLRHLLRYYVIVDVLGSTTSPLPSPSDAPPHQLSLLPILPTLYGNGLGTCFPCPPELFASIIRINHLRVKFHALQSLGTEVLVEDDERDVAGMDVLRGIRGYDVQSWAMGVVFEGGKSVSGEGIVGGGVTNVREDVGLAGEDVYGVNSGRKGNGGKGPGFGAWMAVGRAYQCAVGIYCVAGLVGHVQGGGRDTTRGDELSREGVLRNVRKTCFETLVQQLRVVRAHTQLRKLMLWPLVVAGIETDDDEVKKFVLDELAWTSQAVGIAAPLLARQFLQDRAWRIPVGRRKWDDLFDRPYLFAV
ncbi:hypothetical protein OQA88_9174 [Cercophora sp. LCS_1]